MFIKNGPTHFLTTLDVYEDGAVDAWGFLDRALARAKLASGWISPAPPAASPVSIHHLMSCVVRRGSWRLDRAGVERAIDDVVGALSTPEIPLLDMCGTDVELRGAVRYSKMGLDDQHPILERAGEPPIGGVGAWVALRDGDGARVTQWSLFENGDARFGADPRISLTASIDRAMRDGLDAIEDGTNVRFDDLGAAEVESVTVYVPVRDILTELQDRLEQRRGAVGLGRRASDALEVWKRTRTDADLARLRGAYHAVPPHLRRYLGDMDMKDWEFRSALSELDDDEDELDE